MPEPAALLSAARRSAGLSIDTMAALVDCTPDEWREYEAGARDMGSELLDRGARVFGLRLRDLFSGEAEQSPVTLLLRSMSEHVPSLDDYLDLEAHQTLGEFLRRVRDVAELEERMNEQPTWPWLKDLSPQPVDADGEPPHGALDLALHVRAYLGLDAEPIPSMIELVRDRLHIQTFFIEPDVLDRDIDGASTLNPRPAILVNLIAGGTQWWRTRMTLAHELCHLLFDRTVLDQRSRSFFLFSPHDRTRTARPSRRHEPIDHFTSVERRASAFAAYFLAPPQGVRTLVAELHPASEEAIHRVCAGYMVGRQTAINLLTNIYRLPRPLRLEMESRHHGDLLPDHHKDLCVPGPGLRDADFEDRVMRAFAAEQIDAMDARRFLDLPLSEPLPLRPTIHPSRCQPLRTQEANVRTQADRFLAERTRDPGYYVDKIQRWDGGWRATIYHMTREGHSTLAGILELTPSLAVHEPVPWLDPNGPGIGRS